MDECLLPITYVNYRPTFSNGNRVSVTSKLTRHTKRASNNSEPYGVTLLRSCGLVAQALGVVALEQDRAMLCSALLFPAVFGASGSSIALRPS